MILTQFIKYVHTPFISSEYLLSKQEFAGHHPVTAGALNKPKAYMKHSLQQNKMKGKDQFRLRKINILLVFLLDGDGVWLITQPAN